VGAGRSRKCRLRVIATERLETTEVHMKSGEVLLVRGNAGFIEDALGRAAKGRGRLGVVVIRGAEPREGGILPADVDHVSPGPDGWPDKPEET
jgi:hypothetical protein